MDDGLITLAVLESLAGSSAFRRGEAYFSVGAVGRLRLTDDRIAALVEGSESYQVELRDDRGELAGDCSCPRAAEGYFCKHCVAVGLAWLAEQAAPDKPAATPGKARRRDPWRDIEAYLTTQPPAALIELLLGVAPAGNRRRAAPPWLCRLAAGRDLRPCHRPGCGFADGAAQAGHRRHTGRTARVCHRVCRDCPGRGR